MILQSFEFSVKEKTDDFKLESFEAGLVVLECKWNI